MVKPDVKVNYYAALELGADASVEDVKKQYRKLALKYHPDRNPGKEEEHIPRFQAISAAHEILSDPATKTKYDGDRRRANLSGAATAPRPGPSGQRGNPYTATSSFQPPPRRTADPTGWSKKPAPGPNSTSGADRFANFPGPGPTSRQSTTNKSSASEAWSYMGGQKAPTSAQGPNTASPRQRRAPPVPPRGTVPVTPKAAPHPREEEIRAGMNYRPGPAFNSAAYAHFNGANSTTERPDLPRNNTTTSTPRRTGFDPNAPGSDERPPAGPSSYATSTFKRPPFGDPNRATSAYPNVGGEKTSVSPEDLKRSHSVRDATKLSQQSTTRHRSASPTKSKSPNGQSAAFTMDSDSSSDSSDDLPQKGQFGTRPKKVPVSRMSKTSLHDRTTPAQSRPTSQAGQPSDNGDSNATGKPTHNMYDTSPSPEPFQPARADWHEYYPFNSKKPGPGVRPGRVPSWAMPSSVRIAAAMLPRASPYVSPQHYAFHALFPEHEQEDAVDDEDLGYVPDSPLIDVTDPEPHGFPTAPCFSHNQDMHLLNSEFDGFVDSACDHDFLKATADSLSCRFTMPAGVDSYSGNKRPSSSEINTAFSPSGGAPIFTGSNTGLHTPVSRRGSPAKRGKSVKSAGSSIQGDFLPPRGANTEWQDFQFGEPPRRASEGAAAKGTSVPQPATVHDTSDISEEPEARIGTFTDDAMDIDQTPPAQERTSRPVAVTPSQWRQMQDMPPPPSRRSSVRTAGEQASEARRKSSTSAIPSLNPLSESLNGTTANGLDDLSSLNDSVPFTSKASSVHPSKLFVPEATPAALPGVPSPPEVPQLLTKTSWKDYSARMAAYLAGPWHQFQTQLAEHNKRTLEIEQQLLFKGSTGLEARGATSTDVSVEAYLARCREQERWAELHAMALGKHNAAIDTFARTKERVREMAEKGTLTDGRTMAF